MRFEPPQRLGEDRAGDAADQVDEFAVADRAVGQEELIGKPPGTRAAALPTEVLVRVRAIGLNPLESMLRSGGVPVSPPLRFVPGWDISGVVEDARTHRFRPGDAMFGRPLFPRAANGYAECVAAPALHPVRKPDALSHVEAAALPIVGLTALAGAGRPHGRDRGRAGARPR